jgi:hypothetical protein
VGPAALNLSISFEPKGGNGIKKLSRYEKIPVSSKGFKIAGEALKAFFILLEL